MKKLYPVIILAVLVVISINIIFFTRFKNNIIDYQKSIVSEQVNLCGSYIEKSINSYQNDIAKILFENFHELPEIFNDGKTFRSISNELQVLYSKNKDLISNISIYDNDESYLGIYLKDNNDLVIDTFPHQFKNDLQLKEIILNQKNHFTSYFPFFKNNELTGNLVVEINLEKYLNSIFSLFKLHNLQWQWLANNNGQVLMSNYPQSISISDLENISKGLSTEEHFVLEHIYTDSLNSERKIISAVYPLNVLNNDLGIVFTIEAGELNSVFLRQNFLLISISLTIMILVIGLVVYRIHYERKMHDKGASELMALKMIVEHFPVGIMIIDSLGTIKNINRTAQKMLFLEKNDDITGQ